MKNLTTMNFRLQICTLVACLAVLSWSPTTYAQIGGGGTLGSTGDANTGDQSGTGNTANAGTGTNAATGGAGIQSVPDTSAFDQIQRGDTLGSAATSGFGPAATANAGGAGAFGGGGGFGGFGGLGGLGGLFGGGLGGGAQSTKPTIRTRLRSAIQVAPMPAQRVQFNANQRFVQLPQRQGMQNVQVGVDGRTAVIEGTATSDRDRRMAELLMRLEPGVSQVQNNVRVSP